MINLDEQLKQLPGEFVVEMEKQKTDRWEDVYQFILEYFDLSEAMKNVVKIKKYYSEHTETML